MKTAVLFADDKRRRNKQHEQTIFSIIQSVRRFVSRRLEESELSRPDVEIFCDGQQVVQLHIANIIV